MNTITPLKPYFAMIVTFAQRYQQDAGVILVLWTLLLPRGTNRTPGWGWS
jgi:p-aminobenzoyl-glutamate transporter AbgT